jgi:hypothetical protein
MAVTAPRIAGDTVENLLPIGQVLDFSFQLREAILVIGHGSHLFRC